VENSITQTEPDGTETERFQTVSALETPAAMEELHTAFDRARDGGHHPLLAIGCYVFDFLAIHPFRDGNGRIGRLLTLLALRLLLLWHGIRTPTLAYSFHGQSLDGQR
jgi:Fic family protein